MCCRILAWFCGVMRRSTWPACVVAFRMGAVQGWYWGVRESSYSYHAWAAASSYSFTLQAFPVVRHARLNWERKEATKRTYTGTLKGHLCRPKHGHKHLHSQRQTMFSFTGGSADDSKFIGLYHFNYHSGSTRDHCNLFQNRSILNVTCSRISPRSFMSYTVCRANLRGWHNVTQQNMEQFIK